MMLRLIRHLWGTTGDWEDIFPEFKKTGYYGIESLVPTPLDRKRFLKLLDANSLAFIPLICSEGFSVKDHIRSFRDQIAIAKSLNAFQITAHSGRDAFSESESSEYFKAALEIEANAGIAVAHETHRARILYNPWITSQLLEQFNDLKLCCDFSHWVCVCERLIDDQINIIARSAERCVHIHARVGYAQGPQVPDPRAPEYQPQVKAHERWWRMIWDSQKKRGLNFSTLTPEFGPPDYLHTLPYSQIPVGDLPAICDWQAKRQANNFSLHFNKRYSL